MHANISTQDKLYYITYIDRDIIIRCMSPLPLKSLTLKFSFNALCSLIEYMYNISDWCDYAEEWISEWMNEWMKGWELKCKIPRKPQYFVNKLEREGGKFLNRLSMKINKKCIPALKDLLTL